MKDEEHQLVNDEVKLLRVETSKLQDFWQGQFETWTGEKDDLQDEITALRDSLESVETYYQEATDMRREESQALKDQTENLREKEIYYLDLVKQRQESEEAMKDQKE